MKTTRNGGSHVEDIEMCNYFIGWIEQVMMGSGKVFYAYGQKKKKKCKYYWEKKNYEINWFVK